MDATEFQYGVQVERSADGAPVVVQTLTAPRHGAQVLIGIPLPRSGGTYSRRLDLQQLDQLITDLEHARATAYAHDALLRPSHHGQALTDEHGLVAGTLEDVAVLEGSN